MFRWFDSESPIMTALGELLDWFLLSLLTWVCSLPIITAGLAWTALYGVMADRAGNDLPSALRSYFSHVRHLFRPALTNWLLFFAAGCFLSMEFRIVGKMPDEVRTFFWAGTFLLTFCLFLTGAFLVPLLYAKPTLSRKRLWKTAFIHGIAHLPQSLKILSALLLPGILFFLSPKWFWFLLPIWVFFWPAASTWLWVRTVTSLPPDTWNQF